MEFWEADNRTMKISINLATRPYADQGPAIKRLRMGMAVLAVVLCGLAFGLMHFHQAALKMTAQEDAVDRAVAKIQREQQGYQAQMQQPANARVLQQAEFLNGLFDEKAFSWTAAMEDLERVLPAGVQVTAIEPARGKDGRITLHLRVSGQRERSVAMLRNMEHSRRFSAPRISGENAENSAGGGLQTVQDSGKVTFDILAEYSPATLEERKAEIAASKHGRAGALPATGSGMRAHGAAADAPPQLPRAQRPAYLPPSQPLNPAASASGMRSRNRPAIPMSIPGQAGPPIPNPTPDQGGPQ